MPQFSISITNQENSFPSFPELKPDMSEYRKSRRRSTILDKLEADAAEKSNRKAIQDAKDREFLEQLRQIEVRSNLNMKILFIMFKLLCFIFIK